MLTRCDCTTRNAKKAARLSRRMDELEERIERLEQRLREIDEALVDPEVYTDGERCRALQAEREAVIGDRLVQAGGERYPFGPARRRTLWRARCLWGHR